jgi:hypothetical protein
MQGVSVLDAFWPAGGGQSQLSAYDRCFEEGLLPL